ncbi:hypothetical protein CLU81_3551 [Flavobacterium sp. 9]|uniref:hypothetical protein n=1 Tax=Flavobacterium sp. 9 TaxID=2035198 RepID=UPI000C684732|nr:hypothetical protein [Flavobacterium sp. 9]PIF32981.1 hypothetical protein CLU81_3551 [Flavobacterium sp. 9]
MRKQITILILMFCYLGYGQNSDLCNNIKINEDKFSKKTSYSSPITDRISFKKSGAIISIRIDIPGSTLSTGEKGVILLLRDGTQISKPNEPIYIGVRDSYRYSANFTLSKAQIQRIIDNPITDVKLYIYEAEVFDSEKYSEYLKCLVSM